MAKDIAKKIKSLNALNIKKFEVTEIGLLKF